MTSHALRAAGSPAKADRASGGAVLPRCRALLIYDCSGALPFQG